MDFLPSSFAYTGYMHYHLLMLEIILIILVIIAILLMAGCEYFLRFALSPGKDEVDTSNLDEDTIRQRAEEKERSLLFLESSEDVFIRSTDALQLHGYLKRAKSQIYLITMHGYHGFATNNTPLARFLHETGINTLVVDQRAHGESGGRWITMGKMESKDLLCWTDYVRTLDPEAKIIWHGVSMGSTTVLLATGENPENVKAVVSDCGYSTLYGEFSTQLKAMYHRPAFPILDLISFWSHLRIGLSFKQVDAIRAVGKTKLPILFIHGDADDFVPTKMVHELFDACKSEKELWLTKDVAHALSLTVYQEEYCKKVLFFISNHT